MSMADVTAYRYSENQFESFGGIVTKKLLPTEPVDAVAPGGSHCLGLLGSGMVKWPMMLTVWIVDAPGALKRKKQPP